MQPDVQPRDFMLRCLERIATFVDDHDSLDSLGRSAEQAPQKSFG
ncbi:MAG: hypothetical protein ACT4QG_14865 [Sporichthyaceae bacterium]